MKMLLVLLIPISFIFSAKIAVVSTNPKNTYITDDLKQSLTPYGHTVTAVTNPKELWKYDLIVAQNYKKFLETNKKKTILVLDEPPVIIKEHGQIYKLASFLCTFTWDHDQCNRSRFEKYYFPRWNTVHENDHLIPAFEDRSLVCMINSYLKKNHKQELYSKRLEIAKFYDQFHPQDFNLYGYRGWINKFRHVYRGSCGNKNLVYKRNRFCFCYENWKNDCFYISEKIYDAFNCLCIPIYLGSSRITEVIPKEAFIDARDFDSIAAIHDYISNMDKETYQGYIDAIIKYSHNELRYRATYKGFHEQITQKILEILD